MKHFALAVLSLVAAACASSSTNEGTPEAATSARSAASAEPAALAGTWGFVLRQSDVATAIREECAKSSVDTAKVEACWNEIAAQAAREKIRFDRTEDGATRWTSFETDGAKENVFVQVPVELRADGPGHVLAKVTGAPKGTKSEQFAKASVDMMRIEVVDARTIAVVDPRKGRLVYAKE